MHFTIFEDISYKIQESNTAASALTGTELNNENVSMDGEKMPCIFEDST